MGGVAGLPVCVSNWLIAGVRPAPLGNENMTASPSGAFPPPAQAFSTSRPTSSSSSKTLCELIGRPELMRDPPLWPEREGRKRHRDELRSGDRNTRLAARPGRRMVGADEPAGGACGRGARRAVRCWSIRRSPRASCCRRSTMCRTVDKEVSVVRSGFRLGRAANPANRPVAAARRSAPTRGVFSASSAIRNRKIESPGASPKRSENQRRWLRMSAGHAHCETPGPGIPAISEIADPDSLHAIHLVGAEDPSVVIFEGRSGRWANPRRDGHRPRSTVEIR